MPDLDKVLGHFYMEARTKDGDLYRGKSLASLRYGLNRYLKAPPNSKTFDIIHDTTFVGSNELFKLAMQDAKVQGKGDVRHTPVITEDDRQKLYRSIYLCPNTPSGLANKVQFDIRLYFCRRANENMASMTKQTFAVKTDKQTNRKFVYKAQDELTKNHRGGDETFQAGVMGETDDPVYCPVKTFEKYLGLLNPECERLWQYPNVAFSEQDTCWFTKKPIGPTPLRYFMQRLSKQCGLSMVYSNHSIRATGTTILAANSSFSPVDIVAVTGHKSISSLSSYQETSTAVKMSMASSIAANLMPSTQLVPTSSGEPQPSTSSARSQLSSHSQTHAGGPAIVKSVSPRQSLVAPVCGGGSTDLDNMSQTDLDDFLAEKNSPANIHSVTQSSANVSATTLFKNCTFEGATVNVYMK